MKMHEKKGFLVIASILIATAALAVLLALFIMAAVPSAETTALSSTGTVACGRPDLSITSTDIYWASYPSYLASLLMVDFTVANTGAAAALDLSVETAANTGGVITLGLGSPLASAVEISPGGSETFALTYLVPDGVSSFKTSILGSVADSCGTTYELGPGDVSSGSSLPYQVVDTGQDDCYDTSQNIACPASGRVFYGQDAQHYGAQPAYRDNGDGTVTDLNSGLTWQQIADTDGDGDIDAADKLTYDEAVALADSLSLGGFNDWRLPAIKELYSLIDFRGVDPSGYQGTDTSGLTPFIDTSYFDFAYGDTGAGERVIDAQYLSSTSYVSTTMGGNATAFGVNFADGRIKGYPRDRKSFYVIFVRGNTGYGENDFVANGDGTITDSATGLMWMQDDSGAFGAGDRSDGALDWSQALQWAEDLEFAGYSDWRLPNAKELQSIVDYSRSPDTTGSAAIDPLFNATAITNEGGETDYPAYWSSTTHANMLSGGNAAYVCFGRALGYMDGRWMDVHGAGAQRSDPKEGDPADWPYGHGPQGDAIRIYNHVRLVRDAGASGGESPQTTISPGYNLFAPPSETTTYLMDNDGGIVHSWQSAYWSGQSAYLLENGNLLRTGSVANQAFTSVGGNRLGIYLDRQRGLPGGALPSGLPRACEVSVATGVSAGGFAAGTIPSHA